MKTNFILIKEGKAFAVCEEIPKEPNEKDFSGDQWKEGQAIKEYHRSIKRVKKNALEFDSYGLALYHLWKYTSPGVTIPEFKETLEDGTFYPIIINVEITEACGHESCPVDATCEVCASPVKLARIVEEPAIEKIDRFIMDKLIKYPPQVEEPEEKERFVFSENKIGQAATVIMFLGEYIHGLDYGKKEDRTAIDLQNAKDAWNRFTGFEKFTMYDNTHTVATDHTVPDSEVEDQEEFLQKIEFIKGAFQCFVGYKNHDGLKKFLKESKFSITRIKQ